jgi:hypothetical protein
MSVDDVFSHKCLCCARPEDFLRQVKQKAALKLRCPTNISNIHHISLRIRSFLPPLAPFFHTKIIDDCPQVFTKLEVGEGKKEVKIPHALLLKYHSFSRHCRFPYVVFLLNIKNSENLDSESFGRFGLTFIYQIYYHFKWCD